MELDQAVNMYPEPSDNAASTQFMLEDLERSGLEPDDLAAYPIAPNTWGNVQGYCIPYLHNPAMYRIRYNRDSDKYIGPAGLTDIWVPPLLPFEHLIEAQEIWVIEGEKKAAKFYKTFRLPTVAIGGAWMFADSDQGMRQVMLLPNLLKIVCLNKRIKVIFDSDIRSKPAIQKAAQRFGQLIEQVRSTLTVCTVPSRVMTMNAEGISEINTPKGVDDWLVLRPNASLTDIETIDESQMRDSLAAMLRNIGCHFSATNKLLMTERNFSLIIPQLFNNVLSIDEYKGLEFVANDGQVYHGYDEILLQIVCLLQDYIHPKAPKSAITTGFQHTLIRLNKCNRAAEFIAQIPWDGVERLDTWASSQFDSPHQAADYVNEWGRLLICSMVNRIINPGCKVDYAFILVGPQGLGKSTFFYDLGHINNNNYYIEYTPSKNVGSDSEQRTQATIFKENIVIDFSEGVLLQKYSSEEVKALITRREDACRKMQQLDMALYPRHSICVGSSNNNALMHDSTGSRRFLIINVSKVRRLSEELKYQLLAEAYARRATFKGEEWFQINAAIPEGLDPNVYVENAQQAYNTQFQVNDQLFEELVAYLDSEAETAIFAPSNQKAYLKQQLVDILTHKTTMAPHQIHRLLPRIMQHQQFPYTFEYSRKVCKLFKFPNDALRLAFESSVAQSEGTVRVYMFTRKRRDV